MIDSIDYIKRNGQLIKKGKIIPTRVLRCQDRKCQHLMKAQTDLWILPFSHGYVVFSYAGVLTHNSTKSKYNSRHFVFVGSPYHDKGHTIAAVFDENSSSESSFINELNRYIESYVLSINQ